MANAPRTWAVPSRAVVFDDKEAALPAFASRLAKSDMRRLAASDWTDCLRSPAVVRLTGAATDGLAPDAATLEDAFEAFPRSVGNVVDVRDRVSSRRRSRTVTVATTTPTLSLLDVTLAVAKGRVSVSARTTGIGWTRHAMARRYERGSGVTAAGYDIAAALAGRRSLLRLACRRASSLGVADFAVPADDGMMFGTVVPPYGVDAFSSCAAIVFGPGGSEVVQSSPTGPAADGNAWTALTFVSKAELFPRHSARHNLWNRLCALPEVMALDDLPAWGGSEAVVARVEAAMAAVGDDLSSYVSDPEH